MAWMFTASGEPMQQHVVSRDSKGNAGRINLVTWGTNLQFNANLQLHTQAKFHAKFHCEKILLENLAALHSRELYAGATEYETDEVHP